MTTILTSIRSLTRHLNLQNNSLEGVLPPINRLVNLTQLDLSDNNLRGTVPSLLNLTLAYNIDLSNNSFSGPLIAPKSLVTPNCVFVKIRTGFVDNNCFSNCTDYNTALVHHTCCEMRSGAQLCTAMFTQHNNSDNTTVNC
jgi:uncharacterized protein YjbI with pentapeptide repeats